MLFCFLIAFLLGQQDQVPRSPQKDDRGLLKIDPVYFDLAANTGGDLYLWGPGEFAASHLQIPLHHEAVLVAYGAMDAKKTFEIPVESGVKELTVFAGVQRKDLAVLLRPDQTIERDVQSFQHMLVATVKAPAAGIWRLELQGAGTYAVTAHVKADDGPHFGRFALVPPASCEVSFSGSKDAELIFIARDGSLLGTSPIAQCKVPDAPFRAAIRGSDSTGAAFQRMESALHTLERK